jgi:hypothetical protein
MASSRNRLRALRRESEARRRQALYEVELVCGHTSFAHATHKGPVPCLECGTEKEIRFVGNPVL